MQLVVAVHAPSLLSVTTMIKLAIELALTFSLSGIAMYLLGPMIYLIFALVFTAIVFGCLLGVPGKYDPDMGGFSLADVGAAAGFGVVLGVIWPALPLIVVWGAASRRAVSVPSTPPDL